MKSNWDIDTSEADKKRLNTIKRKHDAIRCLTPAKINCIRTPELRNEAIEYISRMELHLMKVRKLLEYQDKIVYNVRYKVKE